MRVVLDQSHWAHIKVTGADRLRFLNGMVCGNARDMQPGQWLRTLTLSHKARVLSIFEMSAFADHLLISCEPELGDKTFEILDKHIVMDDVELERCEMSMHTVWSDASAVWTSAPVYEPTSEGSTMIDVECRRIEAGLPRYGVDVDESNFPFESSLIELVDYEKGCFTGQEPVARVKARGGGGNKMLLGLRAEGDILPVGAALSTPEKADAGQVRSAAMSAEFGSIALAYVHKSAWEPGTEVRVDGRLARVARLPFSAS